MAFWPAAAKQPVGLVSFWGTVETESLGWLGGWHGQFAFLSNFPLFQLCFLLITAPRPTTPMNRCTSLPYVITSELITSLPQLLHCPKFMSFGKCTTLSEPKHTWPGC